MDSEKAVEEALPKVELETLAETKEEKLPEGVELLEDGYIRYLGVIVTPDKKETVSEYEYRHRHGHKHAGEIARRKRAVKRFIENHRKELGPNPYEDFEEFLTDIQKEIPNFYECVFFGKRNNQ